MALVLNLALGTETGSDTRQRLDGVEYRVRVFWRAESIRVDFQFDNEPPPLVYGSPGLWVIELSQSDGTPLLAGQVLRHGVNILGPFTNDPRMPGAGQGQLLAWDFSGDALDPGRDDLVPGSPRRLYYREATEVAA